jgi:hypothetical protein
MGTVILKLMAKQPADRYQSALEAVEAMQRSLGLDLPLETPETSASYLETTALVGREAEMAKLRADFIAACTVEGEGEQVDGEQDLLASERAASLVQTGAVEPLPAGRTVVLRGEKGLGKRRLAEELRCLVQTRGADFLSIECGGPFRDQGRSLERLISRLADPERSEREARSCRDAQAAAVLIRELQIRKEEPVAGIEPVIEELALEILRLIRRK